MATFASPTGHPVAADKAPGAPTSDTEHPDHHNALAASANAAVAYLASEFGSSDPLVASDIGTSVQAYSSVLAATTASFTTADATKLDGIEAGATADQSAAEILSALTTVDGSGSGLDADLLDGNEASAFALASDVTSLTSRVNTISNFASPNAGGVVVGQYYDNSFQGTASSTLAGVANRIDLAPYYTSVDLPIDLIGVAVSTAVASAQGKVVIYSADANGWPDELLYESGTLDFGSTGYKSDALTFTFTKGTIYWVGVRHSSTATLRTINVSSAVNLGLTSSSASNYATILRRTVTFANAAPDPWTFTNSDRVANTTPPSIRFRAA